MILLAVKGDVGNRRWPSAGGDDDVIGGDFAAIEDVVIFTRCRPSSWPDAQVRVLLRICETDARRLC